MVEQTCAHRAPARNSRDSGALVRNLKMIALPGWIAFFSATVLAASMPSMSNARAKGSQSKEGYVVRASEVGAALDSDLINGGGGDDTDVLQSVLNRAADGSRVHLVIDGPTLVSGLNVFGNTTVEC